MTPTTVSLALADAEQLRAALEYEAANGGFTEDPELESSYDQLEAGVMRRREPVLLDPSAAAELLAALSYDADNGKLDDSSLAAYQRLQTTVQAVSA